jgi:hypothetical protein
VRKPAAQENQQAGDVAPTTLYKSIKRAQRRLRARGIMARHIGKSITTATNASVVGSGVGSGMIELSSVNPALPWSETLAFAENV